MEECYQVSVDEIVREFGENDFDVRFAGVIHHSNGDMSSLVWTCGNDRIEVFDTNRKQTLSKYTLPLNSSIKKCIHILDPSKTPSLLMAVEFDQNHFLCRYDIESGRLIQALQFRLQITALNMVLSDDDEGYLDRKLALNSDLHRWEQIVAIGTEEGHVYLLDLGSSDRRTTSDLFTPAKPQFISHGQNADQFSCIDLTEAYQRSEDKFQFTPAYSASSAMHLDKIEVLVTSIAYRSSAHLLVAGFNFGGFFLCSLRDTAARYMILTEEHISEPIMSLTFQEPENDPKATLYLWAHHARGQSTLRSDIMELYALTFDNKSINGAAGLSYDKLEGCTLRLTWTQPGNQVIHISSVSVSSRFSPNRHLEDSSFLKEGGIELRDESLACAMWREVDGTLCGGLFDLNPWYFAQLPASVKIARATGICPYISEFTIPSVGADEKLFAFSVHPHPIRRFPVGNDEAFLLSPSSLTFEMTLVTSKGLIRSSVPSLQDQVLKTLVRKGIKALREPGDYINLMNSIGLVKSNSTDTTLMKGAECILEVLLDHGSLSVLMKFLEESEKEDYELFEWIGRDWIWKEVQSRKLELDQTSAPLFAEAGLDFSMKWNQRLTPQIKTMTNLQKLQSRFNELAQKSIDGYNELESRVNAIGMIEDYGVAMLWLLDWGLLPESQKSRKYFAILGEEIERRRSVVKAEGASLFVDRIAEYAKSSLGPASADFKEDLVYPPESFLELLGIFLLDSVPKVLKRAVMGYFLLDIIQCAEDTDRIEESLQIASAFDSYSFRFFREINPALGDAVRAQWAADCGEDENADNCVHRIAFETLPFADIFELKSKTGKSYSCKSEDERVMLGYEDANDDEGFLDDQLRQGRLLECLRLPLTHKDSAALDSHLTKRRHGKELVALHAYRQMDFSKFIDTRFQNDKATPVWIRALNETHKEMQRIIPHHSTKAGLKIPAISLFEAKHQVRVIKPSQIRKTTATSVKPGNPITSRLKRLKRSFGGKPSPLRLAKTPRPKPRRSTFNFDNVFSNELAEGSEEEDLREEADSSHFKVPSSAVRKSRNDSFLDKSVHDPTAVKQFDDIRSLLQTPPVSRKKKRRSGSEEKVAPTSILKSRERRNQLSQMKLRFNLPEDEGSEKDEDAETLLSRNLDFLDNSPITEQEPHVSTIGRSTRSSENGKKKDHHDNPTPKKSNEEENQEKDEMEYEDAVESSPTTGENGSMTRKDEIRQEQEGSMIIPADSNISSVVKAFEDDEEIFLDYSRHNWDKADEPSVESEKTEEMNVEENSDRTSATEYAVEKTTPYSRPISSLRTPATSRLSFTLSDILKPPPQQKGSETPNLVGSTPGTHFGLLSSGFKPSLKTVEEVANSSLVSEDDSFLESRESALSSSPRGGVTEFVRSPPEWGTSLAPHLIVHETEEQPSLAEDDELPDPDGKDSETLERNEENFVFSPPIKHLTSPRPNSREPSPLSLPEYQGSFINVSDFVFSPPVTRSSSKRRTTQVSLDEIRKSLVPTATKFKAGRRLSIFSSKKDGNRRQSLAPFESHSLNPARLSLAPQLRLLKNQESKDSPIQENPEKMRLSFATPSGNSSSKSSEFIGRLEESIGKSYTAPDPDTAVASFTHELESEAGDPENAPMPITIPDAVVLNSKADESAKESDRNDENDSNQIHSESPKPVEQTQDVATPSGESGKGPSYSPYRADKSPTALEELPEPQNETRPINDEPGATPDRKKSPGRRSKKASVSEESSSVINRPRLRSSSEPPTSDDAGQQVPISSQASSRINDGSLPSVSEEPDATKESHSAQIGAEQTPFKELEKTSKKEEEKESDSHDVSTKPDNSAKTSAQTESDEAKIEDTPVTPSRRKSPMRQVKSLATRISESRSQSSSQDSSDMNRSLPLKRSPGRPRKETRLNKTISADPDDETTASTPKKVKRSPGRPRKVPLRSDSGPSDGGTTESEAELNKPRRSSSRLKKDPLPVLQEREEDSSSISSRANSVDPDHDAASESTGTPGRRRTPTRRVKGVSMSQEDIKPAEPKKSRADGRAASEPLETEKPPVRRSPGRPRKSNLPKLAEVLETSTDAPNASNSTMDFTAPFDVYKKLESETKKGRPTKRRITAGRRTMFTSASSSASESRLDISDTKNDQKKPNVD